MFIDIHAIVAHCTNDNAPLSSPSPVEENATERDSVPLRCALVVDEAGEIETHDLFIENCDNSLIGDW